MFSRTGSAAVSLYNEPAYLVAKTSETMTTLAIKRTTQREFSFKRYLNSKSEFYSMLMQEPTSRILVIRLHLVLISFILTAILAEVSLIATAMAAVMCAWAFYRLKKKGGKV